MFGKHFAEHTIFGFHALVCTVDCGLGADDGLVDEVVSEDGVHCNFLSALLALAIGRNPYFI